MYSVRERLVNRAALRHLRQPFPLSIVERPPQDYVRLDSLDPAVVPLVTAHTVIGVHSVELDRHIDPLERNPLVFGVEPQGNRDTGRKAS